MVKTRVYRADDPQAISAAAKALRNGGVVILPTETVYGMAIDADNKQAMKALYRLKGRAADKPLTRFIGHTEQIPRPGLVLEQQVRKAASVFFPGPLTMVTEDDTGFRLGLRMPDSRFALELTRAVDFMPAVTSANLSGMEPLRDIGAIMDVFGEKVDIIIDEGMIDGIPSSVVSYGRDGITLLRDGAVPFAEILRNSTFTILTVCSGNICRSPAAEYFFKKFLKKKYQTDNLVPFGFTIQSAGTFMISGKQVPRQIEEIMAQDGIDISGHRSQGISFDLLCHADVVYAMDTTHVEYIAENFPEFSDKVRLLLPDSRDIPDPFMQGWEAYENALLMIRKAVLEAVKTL